MEYYSAIKRNAFESVLMRWLDLEPIVQTEVSQKEKYKYRILMYIYDSWKYCQRFSKSPMDMNSPAFPFKVLSSFICPNCFPHIRQL